MLQELAALAAVLAAAAFLVFRWVSSRPFGPTQLRRGRPCSSCKAPILPRGRKHLPIIE
jgi:hypothetical protein